VVTKAARRGVLSSVELALVFVEVFNLTQIMQEQA